MLTVNVVSLFRNSERYLDRYFSQIRELRDYVDVELVIGEGDSTDNTKEMLKKYENVVTPYDCTHGGPVFDSVVDKQRFLQCAYAFNVVWSKLCLHPADVVALIDSDIIWSADDIYTLIADTHEYKIATAPKVCLMRSGWAITDFYNVYDFRRNGKHFTHKYPYFPEYRLTSEYAQIDSAGSVIVMPYKEALKVHSTAKEVIVGLCKQLSVELLLNTNITVYHE